MDGITRPDKAFFTAQARAALLGATLQRIEADDGRETFIVSRWAMTRELPTIEAVEQWLDRVEGK